MSRVKRFLQTMVVGLSLIVLLVPLQPAWAKLAPLLDAASAQGWRARVSPQRVADLTALSADWLAQHASSRSNHPPADPIRQSQTVAEWTVMVHVAADNNLELAGLADINEMEAVGSSPAVNILVQVDRSADYVTLDGDWTETRRYFIQQDDNPEAITSPVVQNLGETDSGRAESIVDFATWGITTYPAQKYMLILWDHGGAWTSHSSDEDSGSDISLPDTVQALEQIVTQTGIGQFEMVGFDMCLMSQLEVYQAIAPFAHYAIGSEENEPGAGWFYFFLDELVRNPAMDGAQLGQHVVDYFMYFLQEVVGDQDVYGLATVDLSHGAEVVTALSRFAEVVKANPEGVLSAIADARNNTIQYGGFNDPQVQDYWSSVDLYHFMELLADISTAPELKQAAQTVMAAVQQLVLYEKHVDALTGSNGVAIFFPSTFKAYKQGAHNERYPREAPATMASWIEFLDVFHGTATATVTAPPGVSILNVYPEVASIHQPAVVTLEVSGRDILRVNYAVTYLKSMTERVVLDYDYLVSRTTTPGGINIIDWSDGVTQLTFTWEAEVPVLTDGTTSTYALLIPNPDNPKVALVNGLYTSAQGGAPVQAQLLFDLERRQSTAVWGLNETGTGNLQPFELNVSAGDTFQPQWLTLDENNQLASTSFGDALTLMSAQSITFEKVPAPSGQYSISFVAENAAGSNNLSETIITVNNEGLDPSLRGYTDLTYGVNFLYPSNWLRPRFTPDGQRLFTGDEATGTLLSLYPYTNVSSAEETDAAIRASWNQLTDLQIQQQRAVEINGLPAFVTDYSYTFNGEGRVGSVIAIYVPDQGVGYAFDLDAPANNPAPAQLALRALVNSINFFQPAEVLGTSTWQTVTVADGLMTFPVPASWTPDQSGEWLLYGPVGQQEIFAAVATAPTSGQSNEALAQGWVAQLQASEQNLQILASEPFYIGGREWHVVVFTYDDVVKMAGAFFTLTNLSGQDVTFWIEAPDAEFDQLYSDVFSVILGGFALAG
ncbi:MAG: hypothetical protein Kow00106_21490 [Anaerolineae bacterium]